MKKPLPGDTNYANFEASAIRVNHAGEYGAGRIYAGQLAILGNDSCAQTIKHMAEQERVHLETFESFINDRKVRPSALMPLWHIGGWALGAGTALLGKEAAMACTVAVEEVIAQHYTEQLAQIDENDTQLCTTVEQFRDEEMEHHDIGLEHDATSAPAYPILSEAIKQLTRSAVWLAKRV